MTYRAQDGSRLSAVEVFGDGGYVGNPRYNVLGEGTVDGEAAVLAVQAA